MLINKFTRKPGSVKFLADRELNS